MRVLILQAISATAALTMFAGCSGGAAIAPKPMSPQRDAQAAMWQVRVVADPLRTLEVAHLGGARLPSFYACPARGTIKYVSDFIADVINVYNGKFAGQSPCGRLASGLQGPWGMFVQTSTHDLYVAEVVGGEVLVYHRGQTTPYNSYVDPTGQQPFDVAVANDGTVIASNSQKPGGGPGSLSTWISGPNGGTFVGNFLMTNDIAGAYVTVKKNGTVYYNDYDTTTNLGALWFLKCPAGVCGVQTQVMGVSFTNPSGMEFDATGDLLANEVGPGFGETFELPNPNPHTFPIIGAPRGMAINPLDHHWFVADTQNNDAAEYSYPSGTLIGTVPGNPDGQMSGIALDP